MWAFCIERTIETRLNEQKKKKSVTENKKQKGFFNKIKAIVDNV